MCRIPCTRPALVGIKREAAKVGAADARYGVFGSDGNVT
jgi:hypothetical protein